MNCDVTGDGDVQSPQAYLRVKDQESLVVGRGDSPRSAVQTGQPSRTLPNVATALEPNVRGQPSAGCELPRPLHVALRMFLLVPYFSLREPSRNTMYVVHPSAWVSVDGDRMVSPQFYWGGGSFLEILTDISELK